MLYVYVYQYRIIINVFIHVLIHLFMCGCTLIYDWSGATLLYT